MTTLLLGRAKQIAGTLGYPSKMPGTSYGLSAYKCKTGAKLAKISGSVCDGCYAMKGHYIYDNVAAAHATRLTGIKSPQWADALVTMLVETHLRGRGTKGRIDSGWHRWHDSGDIQSVDHLKKICDVARKTPHIKHWLPTRELKMVQDYVASGGDVPDN